MCQFLRRLGLIFSNIIQLELKVALECVQTVLGYSGGQVLRNFLHNGWFLAYCFYK